MLPGQSQDLNVASEGLHVHLGAYVQQAVEIEATPHWTKPHWPFPTDSP